MRAIERQTLRLSQKTHCSPRCLFAMFALFVWFVCCCPALPLLLCPTTTPAQITITPSVLESFETPEHLQVGRETSNRRVLSRGDVHKLQQPWSSAKIISESYDSGWKLRRSNPRSDVSISHQNGIARRIELPCPSHLTSYIPGPPKCWTH